MSDKIISLATRRRKRLAIEWRDEQGAPHVGGTYDAWVEIDGSLVLRIARGATTYEKDSLRFGTEERTVFEARPDAYETRIPADAARTFFNAMFRLGNASRKRMETLRGVYEWRCTPFADGTFMVKHAHRHGCFEPFKPKLRKGLVATGKILEDITGHKFEERAQAMVAPTCVACGRVIQVGETAYREKRNPHGRAWPDAVICGGCITNAPREGVRDAGGAT